MFDFVLREDDKLCLWILMVIIWMLRKFMFYIFTVYLIEAKVILNLRYLFFVVESGFIVGDDFKMEVFNWL